MTLSFRNLSIRKKLTALMLLISVLTLIVVSSLYIAEEIYSTRVFLERELSALGRALGDSCKNSLMTQHIATTEDILSSLNGHSSIRAAYLFDQDGEPVAQYLDDSAMPFVLKVIPRDFSESAAKFWVNLERSQVISSLQHFSVFLPIMHNDRQIGSLYLLSDLNNLYQHLKRVAFSVLLLLGIMSVLFWRLAGRLQQPVSRPLLNLVDAMGEVSQNKDFTVRASKEGEDEIGQLVEGFNKMLEQIETHRHELIEHQQSLEATVEKRTEELRQMVAVLEYAKQQAEAASEAKSQFLANITHELRTPLIGVLGMNELMFRTTMNDQQQMLAKTVQNSGENLLELINNVLDFSKIEAGKMQLEKVEFYLYQVVEEVVNLLSGAAEEKGLAIYCRIPLHATCKLLGDKVRIRQILMNLIGNAIKFTEQGAVTVNLDCSVTHASVANVTIEISDTGIGMDVQAQTDVFTVFYQADASHTRKYGGTGLGLAIVQQLVTLLDGFIDVDSQPGKGSCFRVGFSLPVHAEGDIDIPETLRQQPVMVYLEDDSGQQILASRLAELGMQVVSADSAVDAWYQLGAAGRTSRPFAMGLFSSSATLPGGQPLYKAIREEEKLGSLRRILLTTPTQKIELKKQEGKLYLPFGWDSLREALCQSWHELHLVEASVASHPVAVAKPIEPAAKLLLAGGSFASRELIKLSLRNLPITVELAKDMKVLEQVAAEEYVAVLIDVAAQPVEQVVGYCQQGLGELPLFVLAGPADNLAELSDYAAGVLAKPFRVDSFVPLLQPLLPAAAQLATPGARP